MTRFSSTCLPFMPSLRAVAPLGRALPNSFTYWCRRYFLIQFSLDPYHIHLKIYYYSILTECVFLFDQKMLRQRSLFHFLDTFVVIIVLKSAPLRSLMFCFADFLNCCCDREKLRPLISLPATDVRMWLLCSDFLDLGLNACFFGFWAWVRLQKCRRKLHRHETCITMSQSWSQCSCSRQARARGAAQAGARAEGTGTQGSVYLALANPASSWPLNTLNLNTQ